MLFHKYLFYFINGYNQNQAKRATASGDKCYLFNEEKQKSQDPVHLTWIPCMHINMKRSIKQPSKVGACEAWWVNGARHMAWKPLSLKVC